MGNTEIIDTVVDPSVKKQFTDLIESSDAAAASMAATLKVANDLNNSLGGAKNFTQFQAQAKAVSDAVTKSEADSERARLAEIKLQQAREKAFDDYEKKLQRQQAVQDKASQAQTKASAKALSDSQKLQAQQDKAATAFAAGEAKKNQALAVSNRAFNILNKQYTEAIKNAKDIGAAQGVQSRAFIDATEHVKKLEAQVDAINTPLGDFKNKVGGYSRGIADYFGKAYNGIRQIAYILPGVGIGTIFLGIFEAIGAVLPGLGKDFDFMAEKAKGLADAINNAEYKAGVQNILELTNNVKLAKEGFKDKEEVLIQYNKTLGESFGYVTSLDEAEKKLTANSQDYIKALFFKAAAQAVLANGTQALLEAAQKQQKAEDANRDLVKENAEFQKEMAAGGKKAEMNNAYNVEAMIKQNKKLNDKKIADAKAEQEEVTRITSDLYDSMQQLADKFGANFKNNAKAFEFKKAFESVNDELLKRTIQSNQKIVDNDKESYGNRRIALKNLFDAQQALTKLNEKNQLDTGTLTSAEILKINASTTTELLKQQDDYNQKRRELNDKQASQELQHTKNKLSRSKEAAKLTIEDPGTSLDSKLSALDDYKAASAKLIDLQFEQEKRLAGKNNQARVLAEDDYQKEKIALTLDYNAQYDKILQGEYDKQISGARKHDKDLLDLLKTRTSQEIQKIAEAAKAKNDELDAEFKKGGLAYSLYIAKRDANVQAASDKILQINIDEAKKIIALKQKSGLDASTEEKQLADLEVRAFQEKERRKTDALAKEGELRKQLQEKEFELLNSGFAAVTQIVDASYENAIKKTEEQSAGIDKIANSQKDQVEKSLLSAANKQRKESVIDAQAQQQKEALTQKQKEIQHKEAVFNRDIKAAEIFAATAEAVGKIELQAAILEANPYTAYLAALAYAQIPVAIAIGAVQEAAVFASPIPAYKYGTKSAKGGLGLWGEAGVEVAIEPSGKTYASPDKPTLANFPTGTEIISSFELNKLIKPDKLNYAGGSQIPFKQLIDAIKENKPERSRRPIVNIIQNDNSLMRRMRR